MKKFLQSLFNVFWVLIVGIPSAISNALIGLGCMLTIIGIPFGLQYFKFIPLVFAPAGKVAVTKYGSHPVMNTFWLIFGGFSVSILYYLLAGMLYITIIGIPIGRQLLKIADFNFAPFGAEIVKEDEYSKYGNTRHDLILLFRRICADPDKVIGTDNDGAPNTTRDYLKSQGYEYKSEINILQKQSNILSVFIVLGIIICPGVLLSIMSSFFGIEIIETPITLFLLLSPLLSFTFLLQKWQDKKERKITSEIFGNLIDYYPNNSWQISEHEFSNIGWKYKCKFIADKCYEYIGIGTRNELWKKLM